MADINNYIPQLKKFEGGFVNDPDDAGGATNIGITLATFRAHFGAQMTVDDLKNITNAQLIAIYKLDFWNKILGDGINDQQVANAIFDWGVNSGVKTSINHVQEVIGIHPPTGFFGTITLGKVNSADPATLCDAIADARVNFLNAILSTHPNWQKFKDGWLHRANGLRYKV